MSSGRAASLDGTVLSVSFQSKYIIRRNAADPLDLPMASKNAGYHERGHACACIDGTGIECVNCTITCAG